MLAPHLAIYLTNASNKNAIIKQIVANNLLYSYVNLEGLKAGIHSTITIEKIIREEQLHDKIQFKTDENEGLSTMSSGQQKKALLSYLIAQQPDYLILDDVYSNLDQATQAKMELQLLNISNKTLIIQLLYRKKDLLSCIENVLWLDGNNAVVKTEIAKSFRKSKLTLQKQERFQLPTLETQEFSTINPLVQFNDVSVGYGEKKVLNKLNWTIQLGEFWQLMGPNGSGKSTLISLITGDNPRGYGKDLILFGRKKGSGETIWEIKSKIGYFTPAMLNNFNHDDSVENMIISGLNDSIGLYTQPTDLQKQIAAKWIKILGLEFANKQFKYLSVGQQRMVMVARAMVKHPPLLILDEPTVELDDVNTSLFIGLVNAIAIEKKMAILYVSHRYEPELRPTHIMELVPGNEGSIAIVKSM